MGFELCNSVVSQVTPLPFGCGRRLRFAELVPRHPSPKTLNIGSPSGLTPSPRDDLKAWGGPCPMSWTRHYVIQERW